MTALLAAALVAPVVGAVVSAAVTRSSGALARRLEHLVPTVGVVVAGAWAVMASVREAPTWGSLVATPAVAVAVAGVGVLAVAFPARSLVGTAATSIGLTVVGVGATAGGVELPDRSLAGGVAALAVLAAVAALADGAGRWATLLSTGGAVAVAVGAALDDSERGALVAVAGSAVVLLVATRRSPDDPGSGLLVLPALALVVSRTVATAAPADDRLGVAGALLGALVAIAVAVRRGSTERTASDALPLAVVGAGLVVVTQDLAAASGAGLLLVAGGVLALGARHPVGLVAAIPGATAAVVAFGAATGWVHAVAGASAVALLLAGVGANDGRLGTPAATIPRLTVLAAVAFGVLPDWGWAGVALPDHASAVATAAAFALPVIVLLSLPLPTGSQQATGRISRRRETATTPTHGSTIQEAARPQEGRPEEEVLGQEAGEQEDGTTQRPVAVPPQPVLVRARVRGAPLRGRVRARSGRAP